MTTSPPRLDRFQREADDVEQAHRFAFIPRFQAGPEHPKLDRQRGDEQQVVAWHAKDTGAWYQQHCRKEGADEQAGARILEAKIQEFDQAALQARPSGRNRSSSAWMGGCRLNGMLAAMLAHKR